jgi:hypothetical protein
MGQGHWKAWGLIAVSLVLAAYAFGLLYEGFAAQRYFGVFTFPFIDKPAAERAFQRLPPNASLARQEVAARRLIEADPTNPESWDAVSYVEFLKAGGMSAGAIDALDHSYAVSFFDRQAAVWRIGYALENWAALPPALRADVLTEADVALKDPVLGPKLRARLAEVRSPPGRLAAVLILAREAGAGALSFDGARRTG